MSPHGLVPRPFARRAFVEKPSIVGAEWWNESVQAPVSRRHVMVAAIASGVVLAGVGSFLLFKNAEPKVESKSSLAMQEQFGWNFGATGEPLSVDGVAAAPVNPGDLMALPVLLQPSETRHRPYYVPTLFQAPAALPKDTPAEDAQPFQSLRAAIRPVINPAMREAFGAGRGLASLFSTVGKETLVVVDLPGAESVAFAAGGASIFDPVFVFDNWPHPKGVVPAHQTLAAALTFASEFDGAAMGRRGDAPGMLVLDRNRLAPYTESPTQFDNRYVAKLPDEGALRSMGYSHVLYVAPRDGDRESDDLNDDFVAYDKSGISTRIVAADAFARDDSAPVRSVAGRARDYDDGSTYAYGGSLRTHPWFWVHYPFYPAPVIGVQPTRIYQSTSLAIAPRSTPFSSGAASAFAAGRMRIRPLGFATTPVFVSPGGGQVLGSRWSRSGSWNRSGGSGGG